MQEEKKTDLAAKSWFTPGKAQAVADLAHALLVETQGSRLFSLGQSPAWIVRAAEMECAFYHKTLETGYIPFSGKFMELVPANHENGKFAYSYADEFEFLTPQEITTYRNVLTNLGLAPETCVDRLEQNGKKTTITDFFLRGRGSASFLHMLLSWGREQNIETPLRQALDIRLYAIGQNLPTSITVGHFAPLQCTRMPIDFYVRDTLWDCPHEIRIVPTYNPFYWRYPPPPAEGSPELVKSTDAFLAQTVYQACVARQNVAPQALRPQYNHPASFAPNTAAALAPR